jgi:L-ascorbate metabolism protein UlaG (beta-lactamase superfamily)
MFSGAIMSPRILKFLILQACIFLLPLTAATETGRFETDTLATSDGRLQITFLGHASLKMEFHGRHIYIDPCTGVADFSKMPKADIIIFTHEHSDHFDLAALDELRSEDTLVVMTELCAAKYAEGIVMKNEDVKIVQGLRIEGVPAYNVVHKRASGFPYHLKGTGNGYIITFGDMRVYIAGDTEKIPEMKELSDIDVAFLPVALPDTMTVEMAADAVKVIRPKIFYPYRYDDTDISELKELLKGQSETEVRIRNMK